MTASTAWPAGGTTRVGARPPVGVPLAVGMLAAAAFMPYRGEVLVAAAMAGLAVCCLASARAVGPVVPVAALLLGCWVALSAVWPLLPEATALAAGRWLCLALVGVAVAAGRGTADLAGVVVAAGKAILVLCWLAALLVPRVGTTQAGYEHGALEGLFVHRNYMGYAATWVLVSFVVMLRSGPGGRLRARDAAWTVLALASLSASASRSAWFVSAMVLVTAATLGWASRLSRPRGAAVTLACVALVTVAGALAARGDAVAEAVGREATLTGRTTIWAAVVQAAAERWATGYGWGAAWLDASPLAQRLADDVGFRFYHAHNGYLDVVLQTGLVGALLALAFVVGVLARALRAYAEHPSRENLWAVLLVLVVVLMNMTESVAMDGSGLVLLVAVAARQLTPPPAVVESRVARP